MINEVITLNIQGNGVSFEEGTDIRVLAQSLTSLQKLIEKIYLFAEGKSKMAESDYQNLKIQLINPHSGSWETDVLIGIQNVVFPITPFILQNNGDILQTIKNIYDFITYKIRAKEEGKKIEVKIENTNGLVNYISKNSGSVTIECPINIPELAEETAKCLQNLTKPIDGQSVSKVKLEGNSSSLELDNNDSKKFKSHSFTSDETFFLRGNIREAKADNYSGVIRVIETDDDDLVPGEDYHFVSKNVFDEEQFSESFLKDTDFEGKKRILIGPENNFDGQVKLIVIEKML
ncbi:hypothetical protein ACVRW4_00295 [Streptococcus phocae subsp. phocae]|uniref:Uncharacterized protein n=1 Tax=Streptococcus phocae TaxID=119224 RepID=A0A0P6SJ74_9STRE|nr:hypothetical protein [Streptococcus phocae]KPJ22282.1 hypothetical protein AKK44_05315 [Streptococcus phocae]